ncbi:cobaltochelatase subunit CobN, partial [Alistipes putredinis]|uniref:cobaltochelatase subunit CobN n=1 Tax=Alistipes putredinis TaxID=28117 RepID=UPI00210A3710
AATPRENTADQKREAQAIAEVERTVTNIQNYKRALEESPDMEMRSILNALAGGYVAPPSGGDAGANPQAVPTGRN